MAFKQHIIIGFLIFISVNSLNAQLKISEKDCTLITSDSITNNFEFSKIFNAEVHHSYINPESFFIELENDYKKGIISWTSPNEKFKIRKKITDFKGYKYPLDSFGDIDYEKIDNAKIQSLIDSEFERIINHKSRTFDNILLIKKCKNRQTLIAVGEKNGTIFFIKKIVASVSGGIHAYVELELNYPQNYDVEYRKVAILFLNNFKND